MAKVNNIKINGTTRYIENISYQTALPTATSDSADFVSVNNELYAKQVNNGVYSYAKVGGDGGAEIITADMSWMTSATSGVIPEEYRDIERVKKAIIVVAPIETSGVAYRFIKQQDNRLYFDSVNLWNDGVSGYIKLGSVSVDTDSWAFDVYSNEAPIMVGNDTSGYFSEITTAKNPLKTLAITPHANTQVQPYGVAITDVPATATNGTLTQDQLEILQASDSNYIMFNNEKYYLNDKGHTEGYLSYSHVGVVSEDIFVKVITITISTRGWVLVEQQVNAGGGGGSNIEVVEVDSDTIDLVIS